MSHPSKDCLFHHPNNIYLHIFAHKHTTVTQQKNILPSHRDHTVTFKIIIKQV